jgi:uncharacterized protein YyaL (SSP411 family)
MIRKFFIVLAVCMTSVIHAAEPAEISWQPWSDAIFAKAKAENRFIIFDLEAVWCHWCHVMDHDTYHNMAIINIINAHYIPVREDQDARPDLSNRYQNYGWPATIILNSNGTEVAELSGYIPSEKMQQILETIASNASALTLKKTVEADTYAADPFLSKKLQSALEDRQTILYDDQKKGWGGKNGGQKYLDRDTVEYALLKAANGDKISEKRAKETLHAQLNLLDPVWGGMYQYSTYGDWVHPHFEKIMAIQTSNIRIYSAAYALWHDPLYLQTAEKIYGFLQNFLLSPEGVFYTSQDADVIQGEHSGKYFKLDDKGRRTQGMPRVDKHIYARENGWVIDALVQLYDVTGNTSYLAQAEKTARWIMAHRSQPGGGFRHDEKDVSGPYLSDTLAMGRAYLSLYAATAKREYLQQASGAADFINTHFQQDKTRPGYLTTVAHGKIMRDVQPDRDENVAVVRFTNLLYRYTGKSVYKTMSEQAMRYLATPGVAAFYYPAPVLLADTEITHEPLHITIVGPKEDVLAKSFYAIALAYPANYKRVEWLDTHEGALPNADVKYPAMTKTAAFVCVNGRCSVPIFKADELLPLIERLDPPSSPAYCGG